ncbi:serine/threonine-protein kinase ATG1c isoform X1 [Canna indica]|uniref:Serine/threonine-protein kinase ATG1c isoform X1 n=1 Tax=Canna indica TaxID=4628 RepID=A0AAQ3Q234_9LILI|nr:serine/threonine-protein kinase ATG1c isoform X1 [Canna indica]
MASPGGVPRWNRVVGDYIIGQQIGTGAFSTVWRARHRVRGTEVAVKEIAMDRLSKKLQENLLSEVFILRRINHPNIIALYDFIQTSGSIYLVLEYCRGGDLSVYIQNHDRVPEAIAKGFMKQLASGLQVLRDNNVIHRDLKPQNLLLSTYDENAVLKIADFGFARSLPPRGLAETLCGSPLYMAPEVMQFQKYDAKADLWSIGVILYQLVTGKTPFTGNSQIQLLQNIVKANELSFPLGYNLSSDCVDLCQKLLRRNAVERLTFEEFFNHQFLAEQPSTDAAKMKVKKGDDIPQLACSQRRFSGENLHDDCLPFPLDEDSSGQDGRFPDPLNKGSVRLTSGFSVDIGQKDLFSSPSKDMAIPSRYSYRHDFSGTHGVIVKEMKYSKEQKPSISSCKGGDSLELVEQDYVLVQGPPLDISSSSVSPSKPSNSPCKSESSPIASQNFSALSAPMPITGAAVNNSHVIGSMESGDSPASGTSHGSMDMTDAMEQPSGHSRTRIRSLQQVASVITDVVKEKIADGRQLEAFSVQLLVLAIWKQALHICHAQAASVSELSPSREVRSRKNCISNTLEYMNCTDTQVLDPVCSEIERDFLHGVEYAEELALEVRQMTVATELPDAIEIIFQSALLLGRQGGVDEMMGNTENASSRYSKAVCLLYFLLVEAPSLALSPPFSLTNSDRYRLRLYIDVLSNRRGQSQFQRMGIKGDYQ